MNSLYSVKDGTVDKTQIVYGRDTNVFDGLVLYASQFTSSGLTSCTDSESDKVIHKTSTTSGLIGTLDIPEVRPGAYSVLVRMRVSNCINSSNIMSVTARSISSSSAAASLKSVGIKPSYFSSTNTWETMSFGINYTPVDKNSKLNIRMNAISNSANISYDIDYVAIIPSGTALGSIG